MQVGAERGLRHGFEAVRDAAPEAFGDEVSAFSGSRQPVQAVLGGGAAAEEVSFLHAGARDKAMQVQGKAGVHPFDPTIFQRRNQGDRMGEAVVDEHLAAAGARVAGCGSRGDAFPLPRFQRGDPGAFPAFRPFAAVFGAGFRHAVPEGVQPRALEVFPTVMKRPALTRAFRRLRRPPQRRFITRAAGTYGVDLPVGETRKRQGARGTVLMVRFHVEGQVDVRQHSARDQKGRGPFAR